MPSASILLAAFTILAGVLLAAIAVGLSVYDAIQKPQEAPLETLDDLKAFCNVVAEPVEFTREGSGLLPLPVPPNPVEYVDGPP